LLSSADNVDLGVGETRTPFEYKNIIYYNLPFIGGRISETKKKFEI